MTKDQRRSLRFAVVTSPASALLGAVLALCFVQSWGALSIGLVFGPLLTLLAGPRWLAWRRAIVHRRYAARHSAA